jgi:hypothetical protein
MASSSRSQVQTQTASAAARLAWDRPSVDVRWRPPSAVAIVTHFVTQFLRAPEQGRVPNHLTRKMEISWACGSGPWPSGPVRVCEGGMGQAAWAGSVPSGSGSGMRQRVTSKPRAPSLPTWWATWRRTWRWRS